MRRTYLVLLVLIAVGVLVAAARIDTAGEANQPNAQPAGAMPPELTSKPWLNEIVRHLYRWHIDERDIDTVIKEGKVVFWVRELKPKLDEGDKSRFAEVVLPQFSMEVKVKQADYTIPELNTTVKNSTFRIIHVGKIEAPKAKPEACIEVTADYANLRDELFRTRNAAAFPEGELLERLRAAVRTEVAKDGAREPLPAEKQLVHLAPISPMANEAWVFWETGRTLIRFSSDIDLTNPAVGTTRRLRSSSFPWTRRSSFRWMKLPGAMPS